MLNNNFTGNDNFNILRAKDIGEYVFLIIIIPTLTIFFITLIIYSFKCCADTFNIKSNCRSCYNAQKCITRWRKKSYKKRNKVNPI